VYNSLHSQSAVYNMNLDRFQNSPTGRAIKVWQAQPPYWAFVPNPLPPQFEFDHALVSVLSEADRALGELAGLGRTLPNPNLLIRPFIRREAVLSSRIEGTQADVADLYAYEARQLALPLAPSASSDTDVREVFNYVRALEYGLERLSTLPVSVRLIREVHEILMKGVRGEFATPGEFRHTQNWIGRPGCTLEDATYVPPPVTDMQQALSDLEKYLHSEDTLPPLIRLALIHYQFEAIHPFIDGNGRIGRLLISLLLINWNLQPVPLLYLSAYFEHHRDAYYDRLLAVSERGAWRDWLEFFLQGITEQSRDAIARARQIQDLQAQWREQLTRTRSSTLLLRLVDGLFDTPMLTIPQAQKLLGITYRSAANNVQKLVKAGILHEAEATPQGRVFVAREILQAVAETA
jgi:Fic family protein